jgi:hypothetical protein
MNIKANDVCEATKKILVNHYACNVSERNKALSTEIILYVQQLQQTNFSTYTPKYYLKSAAFFCEWSSMLHSIKIHPVLLELKLAYEWKCTTTNLQEVFFCAHRNLQMQFLTPHKRLILGINDQLPSYQYSQA